MSSNANTLRPESKITEVTVFESSAQVRRVATVEKMPKGEVIVIFSDLPQNLDRENVQVAVRFDQEDQTKQDASSDKQATCSLRGVGFKTETVTKEQRTGTDAECEALRDKIKQLKRDVQDAQDELSDATSQGSFFRECMKSALSGDRKEEDSSAVLGDVSHWKKMFDTAHSEDKEALTKQREIEKKIAEIREQITVTENELRQKGGGTVISSKNVVAVTLVASRELNNVDVRISYVVTNAKWSAEYDVRYDPEKSEAKVTYNAVVSQHGSEVWNNVILTISTARPTISGKPAELSPWRTNIYEPIKVYRQSKKSSSFFGSNARNNNAPVLECASAMALNDNESYCEDIDQINDIETRLQNLKAPTVETAKVKEGATSMSFHIDNHPYTVTNNGKSVRVTLAIVPVKSSVSYITRPKLTETVFARMKAVNLSEFTLLPGPALVFCGQQFISKTTLSRCSPSDDFSVNLGADNDITVKYRRLKNERTETGGGIMSSKKIKYNVQTKIVLNNRKKLPIEIIVEDQIPLSKHGDIEIALVHPPPPQEEGEEERKEQLRQGLVKFELKVPPQKEENLLIEFNVKHPKDFDMEGL